MSQPPDTSEPSDDRLGPAPGDRRTALPLVCLLLASAAGAVFAASALWQATAVVHALLEFTDTSAPAPQRTATAMKAKAGTLPASAAATGARSKAPALPARSPARAAREAAVARASEPLLASLPPGSAPQASARFEERAEASEKAIPLGLEATLNEAEEGLTLGEPPPAGFPYERCEGVFVYIVTIAEGAPLHSAASLGIGKRGRARLRRPGERIGDWTVLAIEDDWTGLNPDVWLEKDGQACRAELAGNPDRVHEALKKPKPKPKRRPRRRRRKR